MGGFPVRYVSRTPSNVKPEFEEHRHNHPTKLQLSLQSCRRSELKAPKPQHASQKPAPPTETPQARWEAMHRDNKTWPSASRTEAAKCDHESI